MKTLTTLALMILTSVSLSSQITVKPKAAFDVFAGGYSMTHKVQVPNLINPTQSNLMPYRNSVDYRTRLGLDFKWKDFTVNVDHHTYMDWGNENRISFAPRISKFFIGASYEWNKIKLKYEHMCIHPIKSNNWDTIELYGSYDMISVSYNY